MLALGKGVERMGTFTTVGNCYLGGHANFKGELSGEVFHEGPAWGGN